MSADLLAAAGIVVSTQHYGRRWAYVIDQPGFHAYVSIYRYGSDETAMHAGIKDATNIARRIAVKALMRLVTS